MKTFTLDIFPHHTWGIITGYTDEAGVPSKIIEMGFLPDTQFKIMHQAPFGGPLYIEFGVEKSRIALRKEEAKWIHCHQLSEEEKSIINSFSYP